MKRSEYEYRLRRYDDEIAFNMRIRCHRVAAKWERERFKFVMNNKDKIEDDEGIQDEGGDKPDCKGQAKDHIRLTGMA